MNIIGLLYLIFGMGYLIYSVICRNKVTLYNRKNEMIIIKLKEFLRLQVYFAIVNSLYLIVLGTILIKFGTEITSTTYYSVYSLIGVMIFHFINFIFKMVSKRKGYVTYNGYTIIFIY